MTFFHTFIQQFIELSLLYGKDLAEMNLIYDRQHYPLYYMFEHRKMYPISPDFFLSYRVQNFVVTQFLDELMAHGQITSETKQTVLAISRSIYEPVFVKLDTQEIFFKIFLVEYQCQVKSVNLLLRAALLVSTQGNVFFGACMNF